MKKVNIYTYSTIKGPGTKSGSYTYLLEYVTEKGTATLTKQGAMEQVTENQAELRVLLEAANRIHEPCEITVFTESDYLKNGVEGWLDRWKAADWKNSKGKEVANSEEWKKVAELLGTHHIVILAKEAHSYRSWIRSETEKKEKERKACTTDLENLTAQKKSTKPQ